ncbi:MAG: hypothetical protein KDB03_17095 [Planctomycetales bacterium]|nr:hypothetical protein [Planctomycetales bacterium]
MDDHLRQQIAELMQQGNKIAAVKLYKDVHGCGLAEAKQAVEDLFPVDSVVGNSPGSSLSESQAGSADVARGSTQLSEQEAIDKILEHLTAGEKIEAIKVYRSYYNSSLMDAKIAIDALQQKHGIQSQKRGGCLGSLLLVASLGIFLLVMFVG